MPQNEGLKLSGTLQVVNAASPWRDHWRSAEASASRRSLASLIEKSLTDHLKTRG